MGSPIVLQTVARVAEVENDTQAGEIEAIIDGIIAGADNQVAQFRSGNEKIIGWFVGQVMQQTQGKANPKIVNELLRSKLAG